MNTCLVLTLIASVFLTASVNLPSNANAEDACTLLQHKQPQTEGVSSPRITPLPQTIGDKCIVTYVNPQTVFAKYDTSSIVPINITTYYAYTPYVNMAHLTYNITIFDSYDTQKVLYRRLFHTHSNSASLLFCPVKVRANCPLSSSNLIGNATMAYLGDSVIHSSIFENGGRFPIKITVLGAGDDTVLYQPTSFENKPVFDTSITVATVHSIPIAANLDSELKDQNVTVISYNNPSNNITFDGNNGTLSWSVPFKLDATELRSPVNSELLVHQEIMIPRTFPNLYNHTSNELAGFNGTIDGQKIVSRQVIVDPFSYTDKIVIHYLIPRSELLELADNPPLQNNNINTIAFSLILPSQTIPEFSNSIIIVVIAMVSIVIVINRFRTNLHSFLS